MIVVRAALDRVQPVDYLIGAMVLAVATLRAYGPLWSECDWYDALRPQRRTILVWMGAAVISPLVVTLALGRPKPLTLAVSSIVVLIATVRLEFLRREVLKIDHRDVSPATRAAIDLSELAAAPLRKATLRPRQACLAGGCLALLFGFLYLMPGAPHLRYFGAAMMTAVAVFVLVLYSDVDRWAGPLAAGISVLLLVLVVLLSWLLARVSDGGVVLPGLVVVPLLLGAIALGERSRRRA